MDATYLLDLASRAFNDREENAIAEFEGLLGATITFQTPEETAARRLDALAARVERTDRAVGINTEAVEAIDRRLIEDSQAIRKVERDSTAALSSVAALDQLLDSDDDSPIAQLGTTVSRLAHTIRGVITEQEETKGRISGDGIRAGIEARLASVEEDMPPDGFTAELKVLDDELERVRKLAATGAADLGRRNEKRLDLLEHRLGLTPGDPIPDEIERIRRLIAGISDAAQTNYAAIADNAERIIGLEAKIADL